jgi:hypothetical protein
MAEQCRFLVFTDTADIANASDCGEKLGKMPMKHRRMYGQEKLGAGIVCKTVWYQ